MRLRSTGMVLGLLAVLGTVAGHACADDDDRDQSLARQAVQRGEIRPLADILQSLRGKLPGEVAGVKIEREGGRLFYEFRVVGSEGRLYEVHVDAATGEIDRTREK